MLNLKPLFALLIAVPLAQLPGRAEAQEEWDALFGGIPNSNLVQAELGFSGLPRAAFHYALSPAMSIGGMFTFDYAYWTPDAAFLPGLFFQAPIRLRLMHENKVSLGLRFDPGIGLQFPNGGDTGFLLLLNAGINFGYAATEQFIVGGGMDLPLGFRLNDPFIAAIPLLFGPGFEFHVAPQLAVTMDMKFGPSIFAGNGGSLVRFGLKLMAGIAYKM